jgi:hypothetical protein
MALSTSDSDDEIEILSETYKGKEVVWIDEDEPMIAKSQAEKTATVPQGHFRLMDLPSELRLYIYQFLLPYNLVISHTPADSYVSNGSPRFRRNTGRWFVDIKTKQGHRVPSAIGRSRRYGVYLDPPGTFLHEVQTQLFLVNKEVSSEVRGKISYSLVRVIGVNKISGAVWFQYIRVHCQW